jgi:hypothetical protein
MAAYERPGEPSHRCLAGDPAYGTRPGHTYRRCMSAQTRLTLVMVADVAREGVEAFQRYEAAVLPMLERHDGRLERRLRTADGQAEVHIVSFGSRAGYDAYIADPERADHRTLLEGVVLTQRLLEVIDVGESRSYSSSTP